MPTITEIANHAGVSRTSVWLALNEKSGISDEMRQRILDARSELVSVESVQRKKGGSETTVSILVLHSTLIMSTEYFKRLLNGIQSACDRHHFQLRLATTEDNAPEQHISNLYFSDPDLRPDGVIYLGSGMLEEILSRSAAINAPLVEIGIPYYADRISYVAPDEEAAGYMATSHLLARGHQRIAVLGHQAGTPHLDQRIAGYQRALQTYGCEVNDEYVFLIEGSHVSFADEKQKIEAITRQFIEVAPDVTALLFTNWQSSEIALPLLQAAGYHIPDDLSVIVFDNFEHARRFDPPLTTVDYPLEALGAGAVRLLIEQFGDTYISRNQAIYRSRLIERASCRPLMATVESEIQRAERG